jgi:DinB superfamily
LVFTNFYFGISLDLCEKFKKMYQTTVLLDNLYQKTESFLEKAVREWQLLPAEQLNRQPAPNAWSAAQCLEHLNVYGRYYLPELKKAIADAKKQPSSTYQSGWLGDYFYRLMLPNTVGSLKSKMKAPKNAIPPVELDSAAVIAEFIEQQEQLLQLIDQARAVNLASMRIPISLTKLIRLKLGDTFLFVIAHNERHILQAERALKR